ncbi:hypothetical protein AC1031_000129 [Aphanomyces cochlioides]|nr:hypothetical protein AC1031_000129 [Aphanomyces cochlioides]
MACHDSGGNQPTTTTQEKTKTQEDKVQLKGSSLLSVPLVLIVALVAFFAGIHNELDATRNLTTLNTTNATLDNTTDIFAERTDKYESVLVQMEPRRLLDSAAECTAPQTILEDNVNVETALSQADTFRRSNKVLMMLNGQNDGVVMEWSKDSGDNCLHSLTATAAAALGANPDYFPNGLRLYNSMGHAITTAAELDVERLAYILMDFQLWVWPGIRVGHKRTVDGVTMTTLSLSPLVYDVEGFFTAEEAEAIITHGMEKLERSSVVDYNGDQGDADEVRTSFTTYFNDSIFARQFRVRGANLTRLPSPSFVEQLQLVRYEAGQFFRKHEDYFEHKKFLGKTTGEAAYDRYKVWCDAVGEMLRTSPPEHAKPLVLPGGELFPEFQNLTLQLTMLQVFRELKPDYFANRGKSEFAEWLDESIEMKAEDAMESLLNGFDGILVDIVDAWEDIAEISDTEAMLPQLEANGASHYFRWIRWAKDRVAQLGDSAPENVQPNGIDYPSFSLDFQHHLMSYIMTDYENVALSDELEEYLTAHAHEDDSLVQGARDHFEIFELAVEAWTKRAGTDLFQYTIPSKIQHADPNRFLTLFLYLNDVEEGGETVFPLSKERLVTDIERTGMDECSEGLAVPPLKLHAALFYSQTGENELDPMSNHGGCPPAKGVKYGANLFMWNMDADEGTSAMSFVDVVDSDEDTSEDAVEDNEEETDS